MAEIEKHKDESMMMLLKHSERILKNDSNLDIVKQKSELNYSIPLNHNGMSDLQYYKRLMKGSYLYGRGSKRENEAVTCCSWVITLPKEISDYSRMNKSDIVRLNPDLEKQFFKGALDFVSRRYGIENIVHNKVHYDEAGQPHIHIYFVPRKELDHDQVHFKTKNTKKAIQTETGRWEYSFRFQTDDDGNKIALKNYAKISDYYDYKLAASEIVNPVELKHFHPDFAKYLNDHHLPGGAFVHTGVTGEKNVSVGTLKEFTKATGITLDKIYDIQNENHLLHERIRDLEDALNDKNKEIDKLMQELSTLKTSVEKGENSWGVNREWGSFSSWGTNNGWGTIQAGNHDLNLDHD